MPNFGQNKKSLRNLLAVFMAALLLLAFSSSSIALAQTDTTTPTTIVISETAKVTNAKRLGVNLGTQNYWDSGMMMRNLAFNNPGFEGESWQSILHCKTVTANSCTDDNVYTYWPANFLAGATASFIVGPAAGTTATVTSSTAPNPGVTATTIQMSGLSVAPSVGDYVVVRMEVPGNATAGWWPQAYGGATYGTETNDISPNSPGKQALVVNASGSGQYVVLANYNDGANNKSFLQLNGAYTISFRAKSIGGSTDLHINLRRLVATPPAVNFLDRDVTLTSQWQDYSFTYNLSEAPKVGPLELSFTLSGGSMLFDDATFAEVAAPGNPTAFRNAVVSTLQTLHPGTIRYQDANNWGSSLDNLIAPDFARERAGYANTNSEQDVIAIGLHDFLVLCQTVGADPWFTMPTGMTTQEMSNLMDYLGGSTSTVYGAKRAALGQTAPWTTVFGQVHLEFGNEVWNTGNAGALITDAASYGKRAGVIFTTAKASPSYSAKSFDFVLDGFWALPNWTQIALQNSKNYDTVDVASYNFASFNDASSMEKIYGPMFAEPEWYNSTGNTALNAAMAATAGPTPANLAVYETNISANSGTANQAQVDDAIPSLGAGLSVASNLLLAQRDLGVTVQNMYSLTGYENSFQGSGSAPAKTTPVWGIIVDMGGPTNLRRPMFLSEQLANSAILPTLLSTSQSGLNPTWNQAQTANDNFSLPNAHYIQSVAYTDGTTLNVILLNLSRTSALPVNFAGLNAPVGAATIRTLTAATINASNETAENVAITTSSQSLVGGSTLTLPPFSMTVVSVPAPVIPVLVTSVTATCARPSLSPGDSTTCTAAVAGQGAGYNTAVVWSAAAGSISSSGAYTAPGTVPAGSKDVITATSVGDRTKSGSFTIALAPNAITGVTASCASTSINQGATVQCTAKVAGTGSFSNAYTWSAPAGSFSSTGSFTAPGSGSSVVVTATSNQDPTKSASVTLNLNVALVINVQTSSTTGTTATVNWTTNMPAYGGINYGTSSQSTASTPGDSKGTTHSFTITGLSPSTSYYLYVLSYVGSQTASQPLVLTTTDGKGGISGVSVACSAAALVLGSSTGCAATVSGSGGYSSAVTWSTSLGSISSTGVLTSPSSTTATALTVTATSVQDPTKSGSASITLTQPPVVTGVTVACQNTTILAGSSTTCSPTVTGTGSISKAVTFAASAGSITSTGVLTAPTTGTSVRVTATSVQDTTKSATATIALTPLPTVTGVSVVCQAASLVTGGSTTCSSTVAGTGNYTSGVTWSASAGSITSAGGFTAPAMGTSAIITATSTQDPTKSGSTTLTLTPALTMSGITTSVTSNTITVNWTTSIAAYGGINYGTGPQSTASTPTVNSTSTTHSMTITGLSPSTSYYLYVISYVGSQTVEQSVTVNTTATPATVTGVAVSCSANLVAGSSTVCTSTVTGTGSYSSAVTWSATNGSISPNGVLTAPTNGTSVVVRAVSVQDPSKTATTTVTVTPLPTISGVTVACPASTLVAGNSTNCTASVTGTGSYSSAVTWSASGGSITPAGLLTSSTTASSVTVQATSVQDPTKSATATIALTQPVTISSIKVYCPVSTLPIAKSVTCFATAVGTGNPSSAVTWSASAGTITAAGVVTAPSVSGGLLTVTATSAQDPTKSGSVTMKVVENLAIINPTFVAAPTTIVVSWNLTDFAYSTVSYNSPNTPTTALPPATRAATGASFTLAGLTPGTTYQLTISSANKFSTVSQQLIVTTPLQ